MLHGSAKRRQMARSLLPSTARRSARQNLEFLHRSHRHAVRSALAAAVCAGAVIDDALLEDAGDAEVPLYPARAIRDVVRQRRAADKVAPFLRWATALTAELPREERLSRLRAALPQGLIGTHALSHLEREEHFATPQWDWWSATRDDRVPKHSRAELAAMLTEVLESPGEHAAFNRAMKASEAFANEGETAGEGPLHRVLLGRHDVEPFLSDVYAAGYAIPGRWQWRHAGDAPRDRADAIRRTGYRPYWLRALWAYAEARASYRPPQGGRPPTPARV
ncbi:MAG: hypothetical protein JO086_06575 [Acidimicrobiia bacterium]|nr:hypothetical protein [Acidimicrobiia bacterium]